ncbi:hypothetical protein COEREDRAFT_80508 [Coemansia reversa NRRL 1564]|uniref:SAM domain-containing protein n=1 Tax=Coemansia reversa (strain ATCC 12441 / NRRL 1564) TaxID=763665 RepID=A0A2G5BES1_COERN|nr:hypothetical protein COEREDRAFT_80508 [Coemansia reversa NRRL 1564]|eukprot:PIA17504.1 hypothetical protein COEREDRAFT_80508 [Coemansia reversa NRRL 1564]
MASPAPAKQQHSPPTTASASSAASSSTDLALPAHPPQWTVDDVYRWAQTQPYVADVAAALREHAIDGHVLINYVTNTVLADELGIAAFGTRVRVLEAIEALRWGLGLCSVRPQPERQSSPASSQSSRRSASQSPISDRDSKDDSPDAAHQSKRSASRVADAEKKRQKRAELKKDPVLYAEYLQKERERNARRRARLRAERGRSNSGGAFDAPPALPASSAAERSSANDYTHATAPAAAAAPPAYAPFAADPLAKPAVHIRHPLQPPPHNMRHGPDTHPSERPAPAHIVQSPGHVL